MMTIKTNMRPNSESGHAHWLVGRLFGQRHWCKSWIEQLTCTDNAFLAHTIEQGREYLHYLCLVRLGLEESGRSGEEPAKQAEWIRTTPKKQVLRALFRPCPEGLPGALKRLGTRPLPRTDYIRLLNLMRSDHAKRVLLGRQRINAPMLDMFDRIPEELKDCRAIADIKTRRDRIVFEYVVQASLRLQCDRHHEEVFASLNRTRNLKQLRSWFRGYIGRVHFEDPPWWGNDWLQPITDAAKLKQAGAMFANCIYDFLTSILRGSHYVYQTNTRQPAMITLVREPYHGWTVDEIDGPHNKKVSAHLQRKILNAFLEAGIPQLLAHRDAIEVDNFLGHL